MRPENEAERQVAAAAAAGTVADLAALPERERVVRGAFLAALLWGEATDEEGNRLEVHRRGLKLVGARIDGDVILRDLGAIGGPAPTLSLTHCVGTDGAAGWALDASGASLVSLDLSHTDVRRVEADGLRTGGDLALSRATIREGMTLLCASIGGQFIADGASLTAGSDDAALAADGAAIKSGVFLRPKDGRCFTANGTVRFPGARIGVQFALGGATLTAGPAGIALLADGVALAGSLFIRSEAGHRFRARGTIRLKNATVEGSLEAIGAELKGGRDGNSLLADGATITGGVFLGPNHDHRFEAQGTVRLFHATIAGQVAACGALLTAGPDGNAILADQATINGSVVLCREGDHRFEAHGTIRFLGAHIGGQLNVSGAMLIAGTQGITLLADRAVIAGAVLVRAEERQRFEAQGTVRLFGSRIGGQLDARGAMMEAGPDGNALVADGAAVAADVILSVEFFHRFEALGTVRMQGVEIRGTLELSGAKLAATVGDPKRTALDLCKARIGTRLLVRSLDPSSTGVIDLSGAHASVLDDVGDHPGTLGWGDNRGGEPPRDPRSGALKGVALRLHGFTYDTLALPEGDQHPSNDLWLARRAWFRRQAAGRPTPRDYTPQPHEQLAKVLRDMGEPAEADRVARDKREWQIECRVDAPLRRRLRQLVGWGFGHYYSTARAIRTLLLYALVGAVGAILAAERGVLVEASPAPAAASPGSAAPKPQPCFQPFFDAPLRVTLSALAHAADTMVPPIDFRIASACAFARSEPGAEWWQVGRVLYALGGLVVVSMAVVTFTGILRRD